jgi:hypothetical protein
MRTEDRERVKNIAGLLDERAGISRHQGEVEGFRDDAAFLRNLADSPVEDSGVEEAGPKYPPAERLVESLRWAIGFIDDPKRRRWPRFRPNVIPGGEMDHDWTEWASALDWLKDAEMAATPDSPPPGDVALLAEALEKLERFDPEHEASGSEFALGNDPIVMEAYSDGDWLRRSDVLAALTDFKAKTKGSE